MPADIFETHTSGLTSPPDRAFSITPDDGTDLALATRAIMIGGAGDIAFVTTAGDSASIAGLQPGVQYALRIQRVLATGTTATGLVGLA